MLLLGGAVAAFVALGQKEAPPTSESTAVPKPVVEVAAVEPHAEGIDFDVDGVVVPFQQVEVPAEVAGRIAYRSDNCRVGRTVAQGELLLKVDAGDYELEVRRLEEALLEARASVSELVVETESRKRQIELAGEDLAIKQREVARYERIEDPGVYSKSELDTVRLKELQARAALQTERDQLSLLEARRNRLTIACELVERQLEKARLDLRRTEIHSPIDGIIVREPVERGTYVQRGGVVAVIQDTSQMEIKCSLRMHQMHWLWQGFSDATEAVPEAPGYDFPETPATVVYKMGETEYRWTGTLVDYDGAQIDQQTRMVPCRALVQNPRDVAAAAKGGAAGTPPGLMAGMFVTVRVHARPRIPMFRIPEAAVQPGNRLWLVDEITGDNPREGRLRQARVEVAYSGDATALVYGGEAALSAGDLVVASPVSVPSEGMAVELLPANHPQMRGHLAGPAGVQGNHAVSTVH
jgi:RND family efflux transporter MFP subunit